MSHYRGRSSPYHFAKIFCIGYFLNPAGELGIFEDRNAAFVRLDFHRFPSGALVETVGIGIGLIPGTIEPVEVRFVVGNPLVDGDWRLVMPPHRSKNSASNLAMT